MNDLVLAAKAADWFRLKALVLDSVSSPITRRVYNMALDEFMVWFRLEPRPGFSKATVSAWRASTRGPQARFVVDHHPWSSYRELAVAAAGAGRREVERNSLQSSYCFPRREQP